MALITKMHRSQLPRSGMALGGIGTGGFEVRQDGGFVHWSIFNNWPLFPGTRYLWNPKQTLFFKLWVRAENENPRLVLLQIEDGHGAGAIDGHEYQYMFPWMSAVDEIETTASFPFADLTFEREGVPLAVSMRAWSPFIPGNAKDSSLPLAFFDFEITSRSERPVDVQVLAVVRNAAAFDQPARVYRNTRVRENGLSAVVLSADQVDPEAATTGAMCLATFGGESTAYMGWEHHHPYYERTLREFPLPEVDDTDGRNSRDPVTGARRADPRCFATLGRHARIEPGGSFSPKFALTWHFPNLYGRIADRSDLPGIPLDEPHGHEQLEGHLYSNWFDSALDVARYAGQERSRLLAETTLFHRTFFDSSLPGFVLDQVNSHLNTLRTSAWLTHSGMFGILEGLSPLKPWAGIATTDVAMYGQIAVALLFPELDRLTVEMWKKFQQPNGCVIHSISCNSHTANPNEITGHRLDMPAQFVFMSLRAALWSGDEEFLRSLWPSVKAALAYVLRERDANGDLLPDMTGIMCSYDNFPMFGVAPYVVTQWLAAIASALVAAERLGDGEFVKEYTLVLENGRRVLEESTWNGSYFQLCSEPVPTDPSGSLGCLSDQILGDGAARQLGLPDIVDPKKRLTALRTVIAMNYKDDQGLRNCQWPGDVWLHDIHQDTWIDQANTCWTGVELNFAAQLLYAGLQENAFEIIRNIDERYRRWGIYWDHQEFGGHYFRPLSALAIPNAFLGVSYDGHTLRIAPARPLPVGRWCVLLPGATATLFRTADGVRLEKKTGSIAPAVIILPEAGTAEVSGFDVEYTSKGTVFERRHC